jgi:hypothetical protein
MPVGIYLYGIAHDVLPDEIREAHEHVHGPRIKFVEAVYLLIRDYIAAPVR